MCHVDKSCYTNMLQPIVYWINIDNCTHRRNHINLEFENAGFAHKRVSAFTPQTMPAYKLASNHRECKPTEFACTFSHLKALQQAVSDDDNGLALTEYFVVAEDDIISPFRLCFSSFVKEAPSDWEVIQMCTNNGPIAQLMFYEMYLNKKEVFCTWIKQSYGTYCYVIKYSAARKMLDQLKYSCGVVDFTLFEPIDNFAHNAPLADLIMYHMNKTYVSTIPWFFALDQESLIHSNHIDTIHKQYTSIAKSIHRHSHLSQRGPLTRFMRKRLDSITHTENENTSHTLIGPPNHFINAGNLQALPFPEDWEIVVLYVESLKVALTLFNNVYMKDGTLFVPWESSHEGKHCYMVRNDRDVNEVDFQTLKTYTCTIPFMYPRSCKTSDIIRNIHAMPMFSNPYMLGNTTQWIRRNSVRFLYWGAQSKSDRARMHAFLSPMVCNPNTLVVNTCATTELGAFDYADLQFQQGTIVAVYPPYEQLNTRDALFVDDIIKLATQEGKWSSVIRAQHWNVAIYVVGSSRLDELIL